MNKDNNRTALANKTSGEKWNVYILMG
jgi:hypothetical protein